MVTLQSLWSHFGHIKARVQKTLILLTDFNDFIKFTGELCITLGHFGVTLKVSLESLWDHFGVTSGM